MEAGASGRAWRLGLGSDAGLGSCWGTTSALLLCQGPIAVETKECRTPVNRPLQFVHVDIQSLGVGEREKVEKERESEVEGRRGMEWKGRRETLSRILLVTQYQDFMLLQFVRAKWRTR